MVPRDQPPHDQEDENYAAPDEENAMALHWLATT
jgi:hypothetical protein